MKKIFIPNVLINSILMVVMLQCITSCRKDKTSKPIIPFDIQEGQSNWTKIPYESMFNLIDTTFYSIVTDVVFNTSNSGFIMTNAGSPPVIVVYHTLNGGITWNKVSSFNGYGGLGAAHGGKIIFPKPNLGFATFFASVGYLFQSYDGGNLWNENDSIPYFNVGFENLYAIDTSNLIVASHKSTDGGLTWDSFTTPDLIVASDFLDINYGVCIVNSNKILKTQDFGSNWQELYTGSGLSEILILDTNIILAAVNNSIIRTSDGGISWVTVYSGEVVNDIIFVNENIGFAACTEASNQQYNSGVILKTVDGGESWYVNYKSNFMSFESLFAWNENTIYCGGYQSHNPDIDSAYIVKTTTQGN